MKKNQTKPTLAKTELRGEPSRPSQKCNLVLKCDYRLEDFIYWPRPSELELAQLAARMGSGSKANPKQSASRAWKLYWECCQIIQADHRKVQAQLDFDNQHDRNYDVSDPPEEDAVPFPAPEKFPVPYAKVERLLLPQSSGRTAGRAQLIREYLFTELVDTVFVLRPKPRQCSYWELRREQPKDLSLMREQLKETISGQFGQLRSRIFDEQQYTRFAGTFIQWHRRYKSEKRADAARKRWAKWKRLKSQTRSDRNANNQK